MIDIPGYEGLYKFDNELNKVFNIKKNRYLKTTLNKSSYYATLSKNGKGKKYTIHYLSNICNPIENINFVDIPNYEGLYKFDNELNKVFNIKKNKYLKTSVNNGFSYVGLYKNKILKIYSIRHLSSISNPIENINFVAILGYDNYKFDMELKQVYNTKKNRYIKNGLCGRGYYQVDLYKNGKGKKYGIHQLVYICNNPTEDITGFEIDHIDNNKLNNNIENLRKCSPSDNCSNKKINITNTTGYKYISKTKSNTYKFQLTKNKISYRKTLKTLEEVIEYRDRFVLEKCGEFANLG